MTTVGETHVVDDRPEVTPSEQAKAATPFSSAAKVVRAVQLRSVRFIAFSAHALEGAHTISDEATYAVSTKFLRPSVEQTADGFSTRTTLLFQVGGKEPLADAPNRPYAVIQATLSATYGLKPESPAFTEDELKDYALCYCPFHVWGYWREFVQSSLARLDLPQFTVPLFLIKQAPDMVRDKLD